MKKLKLIAVTAAALSLCGAFALAGCGNAEMITKDPNNGVSQGVSENVGDYSKIAYYELERPEDVKIAFETDKIQKISYKYNVLGGGDYSFRNDVITIKKSVFDGEKAGDKRIRVFVDDSFTEITLRVVSKVIYTVEDFNSIRNDLNGVYVLGADIDFANQAFQPIGKAIVKSPGYDNFGKPAMQYVTSTFEGIFDGMGHTVKNITINANDRDEGEDNDKDKQGPSLGGDVGNGNNYNNGIFMSTGGSAQIINTNFANITLKCQGLGGAVVGANGGLVKNCFVTCNIECGNGQEASGGIVGVNGSGDAAGKIENCLVVYNGLGGGKHGLAGWNSGIIKDSYAANTNDYVFHVAYDPEIKGIPADFDYDDFFANADNDFIEANGAGWKTIPALPGAFPWADDKYSERVFYKGGDIINSDVVRREFMLDPENFKIERGWDTDVWNFTNGAFPTLKIQNR